MFKFKKSLLIFVLVFSLPLVTFADVAGLTKCSESPSFNKRLDASVKKLEGSLQRNNSVMTRIASVFCSTK